MRAQVNGRKAAQGETDTRAKAVRGDNGLAPTDREINASVLQHCGGGK